MLLIIAEDFIKEEKIQEVLPLYEELVKETRKEVGCYSYELTQDLKQPGHFLFIEKWIDEEALNRHTKSEHFKKLVPLIDTHITKEARYTRMSVVY